MRAKEYSLIALFLLFSVSVTAMTFLLPKPFVVKEEKVLYKDTSTLCQTDNVINASVLYLYVKNNSLTIEYATSNGADALVSIESKYTHITPNSICLLNNRTKDKVKIRYETLTIQHR